MTKHKAVWVAAIVAVVGFSVCASAAEEGWISLFNGKDLSGWQNARNATGENKWKAEDGTLTNIATGHDGNDIATVEKFKDFDLKIEYKTVKDGNSGVYLRGRIELQVLDSAGKNPPGKGDDGAVYDQFPPKVNATKPVGEWNSLEVSYVGDVLTAKLNGKVIHDKQQITKVTGGALPGGVNEAGPLMLQGNHGKVWFRNIMIKPLDKK
jgi:hypothetical protein